MLNSVLELFLLVLQHVRVARPVATPIVCLLDHLSLALAVLLSGGPLCFGGALSVLDLGIGADCNCRATGLKATLLLLHVATTPAAHKFVTNWQHSARPKRVPRLQEGVSKNV